MIVTGVPIEQGFHISKEKDFAQLAAATLKLIGMKEDRIVPVSCPSVPRDRTFATARQVRKWLEAKSPDVRWTCSRWASTRGGRGCSIGWRWGPSIRPGLLPALTAVADPAGMVEDQQRRSHGDQRSHRLSLRQTVLFPQCRRSGRTGAGGGDGKMRTADRAQFGGVVIAVWTLARTLAQTVLAVFSAGRSACLRRFSQCRAATVVFCARALGGLSGQPELDALVQRSAVRAAATTICRGKGEQIGNENQGWIY